MNLFRCFKCNKLLAKLYRGYTTIPARIVPHVTEDSREIDADQTEIEIKCPRCEAMSKLIV